MDKKNTISACIIAHNDEQVIERCLKSVKGCVDEIVVIHDGPCRDKTLQIAKKYTKNIVIRPRKGLMEGHLVFAYKKAKGEWILRIDTDELLPLKTQKIMRKLVSDEKIDGYSLLFRTQYGRESMATDHKLCLFRKSKVNFLEFPLQVEEIDGRVAESDYELEHMPKVNILDISSLKSRHLVTLKKCALYYLVDFTKLEKLGNPKIKFTTKLRKKFPAMIIPPLVIYYLAMNIFNKHLFILKGKIGWKLILFGALFQIILCYFIHKYKMMGINNIRNIMDYSYLWGEKSK